MTTATLTPTDNPEITTPAAKKNLKKMKIGELLEITLNKEEKMPQREAALEMYLKKAKHMVTERQIRQFSEIFTPANGSAGGHEIIQSHVVTFCR